MIKITQYDILEYLSKIKTPLSVKDISEHLEKKEHNINRAINQLSKYNMVNLIIAKMVCRDKGTRVVRLYKINPKINKKYYNNKNI